MDATDWSSSAGIYIIVLGLIPISAVKEPRGADLRRRGTREQASATR
jgi:hypothetical protein